jgi:hypothetical protein
MFEMNMSIVIIILIIVVVSIIAGYIIIKIIDEKLSSVVVNIPTNDYKLPPIYLSLDNNSNMKRIKINDIINNSSEEESVCYNTPEITDDNETILTGNFEDNLATVNFNSSKYNNYDYNTIDQSPIDQNILENFGDLVDYPDNYHKNKRTMIAGKLSTGNVENDNPEYSTKQDPNFNSLNDIPLLVSPDIISPNMKNHVSYPYYSNKAKLVDKNDSPLVKLQNMYVKEINKNDKKNKENFNEDDIPINGIYDGYNSDVKLQNYSFANVTGIGKSLLVGYTNYPVGITG